MFESAGFTVETHVARGTPHRRINGFAERLDADMIVIGSRGQSPLEARLIGSTARNVARTAVRPLLIERIAAEDSTHSVVKEHLFQDVLFATDFSGNAGRAFDFIPRLHGATQRATLLHVRIGRRPRAQQRLAGPARVVDTPLRRRAVRGSDPWRDCSVRRVPKTDSPESNR